METGSKITVVAQSRSHAAAALAAAALGKPRARIWEIDFLRGVFLLGLLLFHLCFDIAFLPMVLADFDQAPVALQGLARWCADFLWAPETVWLIRVFSGGFLVLAGVSCTLSHDNLGRGLRIFLFGLALSYLSLLGTVALQTDILIVFGILHCLGLVILLYGLWQLVERRFGFTVRPVVCLLAGLSVWGLGYWLEYGLRSAVPVLGYGGIDFMGLLRIVTGLAVAPGDTFGLVPNAGKILVGIALGQWLYAKRRTSLCPRLGKAWSKPLCFIGRHTLAFYLLHQPVYVLTLMAILLPLGLQAAII